MKKLDTKIFIDRAKKVHGNRYNYYSTTYKNIRTNIDVICNIHGVFSQNPYAHLSGCGCSKCQNFTLENFIIKAKIKHKSKYNYKLVNIINNKTKIKIICGVHGIFEQTPNSHLNGRGCPKCSKEHSKINKKDILKKFKKIHNNKYSYELLNYHSTKEKIKVTCPIHGSFEQQIVHHLNGHGCPKCAGKNKTINDFIKIANGIHNYKYDYTKSQFTLMKDKIDIICPIHGVFSQTATSHVRGIGCPTCKSSKGELKIKDYLDKMCIRYETQKSFKGCTNKNPLHFDFYLNDYNICIEFNGIQHYKPITLFGGQEGLQKIKINDNIKEDYCLKNNIKLILIKFNDNIEDKLNNVLRIRPLL